MTTLTAPPRTSRLLAGWRATHRADLNAHIEAYGEIPMMASRDADWRSRYLAELRASGLRGRGGAGFPAWRKLESLNSARGAPLVVVNAMEGEPASAKDRVLIECAPHLVLDGAQLTALAAGASGIVVCVPDDQTRTAESIYGATRERSSAGLDAVHVDIARPPGGFVAGEESALVSWLDRRRSLPTYRVDKSIPLRASRHPTLVHNAETLAQIALIFRYGSSWFREVGTSAAPGTTLVTISGAVRHPGVHEVALGSSLAEIVSRSEPATEPGAVLTGGYGGSFIGPGELTCGFSQDELAVVGATTGAGVIAVLPAVSCGVAETARIARYMAGESAGQCGPCVFGLPAIADSLEKLWGADSSEDELHVLQTRLNQVAGRGACRHPDGVARVVTTALRVFAEDFDSHAAGFACRGAKRASVLAVPRLDRKERVS